jgi:hypothetical protein
VLRLVGRTSRCARRLVTAMKTMRTIRWRKR